MLALNDHVAIAFQPLRNTAGHLPAPESLAKKLRSIVQAATSDVERVSPSVTSLFASASVEIWSRGVHSFLISSSVTRSSSLWASVAGYYASHYAVRAFAHLLGYFQVYTEKKIVRIEVDGSHHLCTITKKTGGDAEHKLYWRLVKRSTEFSTDPFFMFNVDKADISDLAHRGFANYADHVNRIEEFSCLDEAVLKSRIEHLSSIELSSVPVPDRRHYPDIESVQLIAYHRLVKFRSLLDDILGSRNKFWNAQRSPRWCANFVDFQVVTPRFVSAYRT